MRNLWNAGRRKEASTEEARWLNMPVIYLASSQTRQIPDIAGHQRGVFQDKFGSPLYAGSMNWKLSAVTLISILWTVFLE